MTRRVVFLVLLALLVGVVSADVALASPMTGTKIEIDGADNTLKTGDYYLRTWVAYLVSLCLGVFGATQFGQRPVVGGSMVGAGGLAALWATVTDSATRSVAAATPGFSFAAQADFWAIWLQRGAYLLTEAWLFCVPLVAWRLRRRVCA